MLFEFFRDSFEVCSISNSLTSTSLESWREETSELIELTFLSRKEFLYVYH